MTLVGPSSPALPALFAGERHMDIGPPARETGDPTFAAQVQDFWKKAGDELQVARRDYWANLAFYMGHQWIWWNREHSRWTRVSDAYSPLGRGRARVVANRFAPNLLNLLGRMLKSELSFEVLPSDAADNFAEGARLAERVLEHDRREKDWESIRFDEMFAAFLGGTSAVCVEWDPTAGVPLMYDEQSRRVVGTGETKLRALNINEFAFEPGVRQYLDATKWCMGIAMPVGLVADRYQLSWTPTPDAMTRGAPLYDMLLEDSGKSTGYNQCLVLCYYERPNRRNPGGYGVVVNGRTIYKGPWPFPFTDLNVTAFRQKRIDGRPYGTTLLNDAANLQVQYNFARSVLAEHLKMAGNARLLAPFGSFDEEDLHDRAGGILWYAPDVAGSQPTWLMPPNLPRWMTGEAEQLRADLDDGMLVHDINRGQGFDRASASALALLSEKDDTPLSPMVFEQKNGWARIGRQTLQLYGEKAKETRSIALPAARGIPETFRWNGNMLQGQYDVQVPLDAVQPRTHAVRALFAQQLWNAGITKDPKVYARQMGLPPEEFNQLLDADADKAWNENYRMAMGLHEVPEDFDVHAIHIAEHNRFRKSDSYRFAAPEVRRIFDQHVMYHEWKATQEAAKQMQRELAVPGASAIPQAHAPEGSSIPLPVEQQNALALQAANGQGGAEGGFQQAASMAGAAAPAAEAGQ